MANNVFMTAAATAPELTVVISLVCMTILHHMSLLQMSTAISCVFAVCNSSPNVDVIKRAKSLVKTIFAKMRGPSSIAFIV